MLFHQVIRKKILMRDTATCENTVFSNLEVEKTFFTEFSNCFVCFFYFSWIMAEKIWSLNIVIFSVSFSYFHCCYLTVKTVFHQNAYTITVYRFMCPCLQQHFHIYRNKEILTLKAPFFQVLSYKRTDTCRYIYCKYIDLLYLQVLVVITERLCGHYWAREPCIYICMDNLIITPTAATPDTVVYFC